MTRTPAREHPLVTAYLTDLERALVAADPRERQDTLDAVREHLTEALGPSPSTADVTEVLADLGSVDVIAASVTPAGQTPAVALAGPTPVPATAAPAPGPDAGAVVALVTAAFALLVMLLAPVVAIPFALAALVVATLRVRSGGSRLAWSAVVLSAGALGVAAVLGLALLATDGDDDPVPGPVHSEPLDQG